MIRAVELVRERLIRATAALEAAGLPYAVAGGNAVASWVSRVDRAAVRDPATADLAPVRTTMERFPFQSGLKTVLARRGVPINPDVRRPLRVLTDHERADLEAWLESSLPAPAR